MSGCLKWTHLWVRQKTVPLSMSYKFFHAVPTLVLFLVVTRATILPKSEIKGWHKPLLKHSVAFLRVGKYRPFFICAELDKVIEGGGFSTEDNLREDGLFWPISCYRVAKPCMKPLFPGLCMFWTKALAGRRWIISLDSSVRCRPRL